MKATLHPESPLDLFWVQNSGLFLDIKIITFLDFDLKFLIFSGCPRKVGNLVSFAVVSILHIVLICFRDTYFQREKNKNHKNGSIICIFRPYLDDNRHFGSYLGLKQSNSCLKQPKTTYFLLRITSQICPEFLDDFGTFSAFVQKFWIIQKFWTRWGLCCIRLFEGFTSRSDVKTSQKEHRTCSQYINLKTEININQFGLLNFV